MTLEERLNFFRETALQNKQSKRRYFYYVFSTCLQVIQCANENVQLVNLICVDTDHRTGEATAYFEIK